MMDTILTGQALFDLNQTMAGAIFDGTVYAWEALPRIKDFIQILAAKLPADFEKIGEAVWVGKGTEIDSTVMIKGPAIIGYNCAIRHAAYIRENVIIGNEVTVGNSTELKNALLFNRVQVPHFNYVGGFHPGLSGASGSRSYPFQREVYWGTGESKKPRHGN